MKRSFLTVLMVSTALSFNALADVPSCGENCTYSLIQNNDDNDNPTYTLKIEPIDTSKSAQIKDYDRKGYLTNSYGHYLGTNEIAPWVENTAITKIEIDNGITSIGDHAFVNMKYVSEVSLPDGLKNIGNTVFHAMTALTTLELPNSVATIGEFGVGNSKFTAINIPESLTKIGDYAFCGIQKESLTIPASVTEISPQAFGKATAGAWATSGIKNLYCSSEIKTQCEAAIESAVAANDLGEVNIIEYKTTDGLYQLLNENGIATGNYYATANDMMNGTNPCADLDFCKANVLKNRGLCTDINGDCKDFVSSANAGRMLKVGSKTYQSLDALLKGDFDRRRIYTVEEANFVTGKKNSVMIRYK